MVDEVAEALVDERDSRTRTDMVELVIVALLKVLCQLLLPLSHFYFCWHSCQVTSFTRRKSVDSYCQLFRTQNASGWPPFAFHQNVDLCFGRVRQAAMECFAVLGQLLAREG